MRRIRRTLSRDEGEDLILRAYMSEDFREGMDAFLNKRTPNWKGRVVTARCGGARDCTAAAGVVGGLTDRPVARSSHPKVSIAWRGRRLELACQSADSGDAAANVPIQIKT